MISIDITVFIHIINMVVLMVVLNKILYKPVLEIMDKRQEKLDALGSDVEQFERSTKDRQAEVERRTRQAGARAKEVLDAARAEAERAGAEQITVVRREADSEKAKELAGLEAQLDDVRKELLDSTAVFAQEMAAKILGRSLEA
ncbi:MAG: ATP synthase F0 subunit B [Candidatus Electrothrix sp. YB6]